jgi:hypothetical protein
MTPYDGLQRHWGALVARLLLARVRAAGHGPASLL